MLKGIRIIGIGMGNPGHLTREAIEALATVDVFLVADKGEAKADLVAARQAICDEFIPASHEFRVVQVSDPQRGPDRERDSAAYGQGVRDWHEARVDAYATVLQSLAPHEETVGFLVWGDPAFYDSTIRIVDALTDHFPATVDVIPGISAPQLLAARHRITLNRIGAPIHVTTGRRLVDEYDPALGDVVVMLDGHLRCRELVDLYPDVILYWGAHLGTPDEVLVSGRLADVIDEASAARDRARAARGWVMDTYLLRPPEDEPDRVGRSWPQVESLSDGVLALRPVAVDDWDVLLAENNNPEAMQWAFTAEPMTERAARELTARAGRDWRSGRAARFVMVDAATGERVGMIAVLRIGPPEVGIIGYGVLPEFRGHGHTVRALRLLRDWVFASTSIARLELGHKVGNEASGIVAARAGFVREGVLAGRLKNPDGTYSDEVSYGFVRP